MKTTNDTNAAVVVALATVIGLLFGLVFVFGG